MNFSKWEEWMKERVLSSPQDAEFIESKTKLEFHEKDSFFHTIYMIERSSIIELEKRLKPHGFELKKYYASETDKRPVHSSPDDYEKFSKEEHFHIQNDSYIFDIETTYVTYSNEIIIDVNLYSPALETLDIREQNEMIYILSHILFDWTKDTLFVKYGDYPSEYNFVLSSGTATTVKFFEKNFSK